MLSTPLAFPVAGHDPSLQFLSPFDLARVIDCLLENHAGGIFNVAPSKPIPLRLALRLCGVRSIPLPHPLLRTVQALGGQGPAEQLDYRRYPLTVSSPALAALRHRPQKSSLEALVEFRETVTGRPLPSRIDRLAPGDDFGMDRDYIRAFGKHLFRFLSDVYWRIEHRGIEHVPLTGRGVLVGMHRGFMPFDGVMALHLLVRETGRYPRFLVHPSLLKFPFLSTFMTRLGGIPATQENAERILAQDELLGIFPEGIEGAFTSYRHAYQLQDFGRDAFVKVALRRGAPILPFVTVGSAEIFPILAKIRWRRWMRFTEWPAFPITPTFPLCPVPLPSRWHTLFLPPMHVERDYPPEAARDPRIVKAISLEVRNRMQQAVDAMLSRRRSIFFGSIFDTAQEVRSEAL